MKRALILVILAIIVSGCVSQPKQPVTSIYIHNDVYDFSEDMRQTMKIPVENLTEIYDLMKEDRFTIVFNGSSEEDNGYFAVAAYNLVFKLSKYKTSHGEIINVSSVLMDELQSVSNSTVIVFRGPNTGATFNLVSLDDGNIVLQGVDYKNITMVSDRLSMIVLGIWTEDDI